MVTGILAVAILLVTLFVFMCFMVAGAHTVATHVPVEGLPSRFIPTARRVVFFTVLALAGGGEVYAVRNAWQDMCAHEQRTQQHLHQPVVQEI